MRLLPGGESSPYRAIVPVLMGALTVQSRGVDLCRLIAPGPIAIVRRLVDGLLLRSGRFLSELGRTSLKECIASVDELDKRRLRRERNERCHRT